MGTAERRREIMLLLCRRRHETIENLAFEFGVSERTIRRDIEAMSLSEPIYTQPGRYGGGVFVQEGYRCDKLFMRSDEAELLKKFCVLAENRDVCSLSSDELVLLKRMIGRYTPPMQNERR